TNWIFRDESLHIDGAMAVIQELRKEYPQLFDAALEETTHLMIEGAIQVEMNFCQDALSQGVTGLSPALMPQYLESVADQRLQSLGFKKRYFRKNPFGFMVLQDVRPLTNFFEKRVTEYAKGFDSRGSAVSFAEAF